jgi:hypothetical protein
VVLRRGFRDLPGPALFAAVGFDAAAFPVMSDFTRNQRFRGGR